MSQDKFLRERRGGIGGSDIGKIFGVSKYGGPVDVYLAKTGKVKDEGDADPVLQRGKYLEPVARKLFCDLTGRKVARQTRLLGDKRYPHVRGHVDGWVLDTDIQPKIRDDDSQALSPVVLPLALGVLEIKLMAAGPFFEVKDYGLDEEKIMQLHTYLGLSKAQWGCWFILCPDPWEWMIVPVLSKPSLEESLLDAGNRFWIDHVAKRVPPTIAQPVPSDLIRPAGRAIERYDQGFADTVSLVLESDALIKRLTLIRDDAKSRLKEAMAQPGLVVTKTGRVTWSQVAGRRSLNKELLMAHYPDVDLTKVQAMSAPYDVIKVTDRGSINEPGQEIRKLESTSADAARAVTGAASDLLNRTADEPPSVSREERPSASC